jgi:pimeloyl-ACP methyl ester carboxylesterase
MKACFMRQILQMKVEGSTLVGTYHQPHQNDESPSAERFDKGILILNTGAAPRSGDGDLNVQLADRLMVLGYHVFRFDMPGLGDSPGDLPEHMATYHLFVKKGGNAPYASRLAAALKHKYDLQGLVLLGNCGGSATAIYVAAQIPEIILGLIHLDPVFHMREAFQEPNAGTTRDGPPTPLPPQKREVKQTLRKYLQHLPGMNAAKSMYRAIAKRKLPKDTCFPLVQCWKQLAALDMPMLVLLAHRLQEDDYLRVLLRHPSPRTTCAEVRNTNHFFSTNEGKAEVFTQVKRWLLENVPPLGKTAPQETPAPDALPANTLQEN